MSDTFLYHGEELHYFDHLYNLTMLNERRVEMAIATHWISWIDPGVRDWGLEVGNVTGHYERRTHATVDLYEQPAWYQEQQPFLNADILDLQWPDGVPKQWPWVLSISTIEHTDDPIRALAVLFSLVEPGGSLLVTFPTGVSNELDSLVYGGAPPFDRRCTLARIEDQEWGQSEPMVVCPYGPWANSVFIGEWMRPE